MNNEPAVVIEREALEVVQSVLMILGTCSTGAGDVVRLHAKAEMVEHASSSALSRMATNASDLPEKRVCRGAPTLHSWPASSSMSRSLSSLQLPHGHGHAISEAEEC